MGNPVVHFELYTKDATRANAFYAKIFGWKIDANNPMNYGMVDTQATGERKGIAGGTYQGEEAPSTMVYVGVPDINATLKAIEAAGGKVKMPRTEIPNVVTMAQFIDTEGNVIGLVEG